MKASVPGLPLPQARSPETATLTRELNVSGQSATMFMLQSVLVGYSYYRHTCYQSQIVALDANTGQVRGAADMTGVLGGDACWTDFIRLTEPGVPGSPTAHVSGRTVTLTWPMTKDTLRYELEAGSAPGLANLATLPLTETQLTVDGAPSGVYYLRVRAKNTIGKSAPSQEIRVVVQ